MSSDVLKNVKMIRGSLSKRYYIHTKVYHVWQNVEVSKYHCNVVEDYSKQAVYLLKNWSWSINNIIIYNITIGTDKQAFFFLCIKKKTVL